MKIIGWSKRCVALAARTVSGLFRDPGTGAVVSLPSNLTLFAEGDVEPVPLAASAWLFGTGLLAMIGIAKRKKAHRLSCLTQGVQTTDSRNGAGGAGTFIPKPKYASSQTIQLYLKMPTCRDF